MPLLILRASIIGSEFIQALIFGLSLGMLYLLVALGLTLIFGLMDVVNFSHGAFVTLGAYVGFVVISIGFNFWTALIISPIFLGIVGVGIERGLVSQLYGQHHAFQLVLTFGIALLIRGALVLRYGQSTNYIDIPPLLSGASISIGPVAIPQYRIFIMFLPIIIISIIGWVLQRTKLGLIIKAGIEDRERTQLLGIHIKRVNMLIFGMGAGLAGLAGTLISPLFGVSPQLGLEFLIIAFVIIVIGGLGNIRGTIAGSIIVGVLSQLSQTFYPGYTDISIFSVMILVLLVRPKGIFGGYT
jgi:branched-chain amino acid transport system permease protein